MLAINHDTQSVLYMNDGLGEFTRMEMNLHDEGRKSYDGAWADVDGDGSAHPASN